MIVLFLTEGNLLFLFFAQRFSVCVIMHALPQKFTRLKKQIIWTHPYVEDMLIEPKGLYNYMLPVLSECFIGSLPALETWPSKRAEKFQPYVSEEKQSLRISAFKRLGLSKLLLGQLTRVLSDAK